MSLTYREREAIGKLKIRIAGLLDALDMIEAIMCDKELCGHFTAEEIREVITKAKNNEGII